MFSIHFKFKTFMSYKIHPVNFSQKGNREKEKTFILPHIDYCSFGFGQYFVDFKCFYSPKFILTKSKDVIRRALCCYHLI